MSKLILIVLTFGYLAFLFGIAWWIERRKNAAFLSSNQAVLYALSLGVYCTAWTYYGSIGWAADGKIDFIAVYLGPLMVIPLWWILLRKMIRISKTKGIGSLADFIAARYGQSQMLGTFVALGLVFGIIPYMALQIKAITESFQLLTEGVFINTGSWFADPGLYLTLMLVVFIILFGARYPEIGRTGQGLRAVIVFESIFKLLAFLIAGFFVAFLLFDNPMSIFTQIAETEKGQSLLQFGGTQAYFDWFWILFISGLAVLLLPRQFQMAVVENKSEKELRTAIWLFPLYLFLINLFVLPIAMGGLLLLGDNYPSDYYLLGLAENGGQWLSVLVYLGGFSAATSMIIVAGLALGNMLTNNVWVPALLRVKLDKEFSGQLVFLRRFSILLVLMLAYFYYRFVSVEYPLVSIGIVSFIAVAQLAPAIIIGMFWSRANYYGALSGLIAGFSIWFLFLILPAISSSWNASIFHLTGDFYQSASNVAALSLSLNFLLFLGVSVFTKQTEEEEAQAEMFVNVYKLSRVYESEGLFRNTTSLKNIEKLLKKFLGKERTKEVLHEYALSYNLPLKSDSTVDSRVISYAERLLTETIGPASARIMIASVVQDEEISMKEVVDILKESQKVIELNKKLKIQSRELKQVSNELHRANKKLIEFSEIKDEFLYTVTHELRTPLTSIRAQAELLLDNEDMETEEKSFFLSNIVKDCERLTRLITDVLDLEKFESGNEKLNLELRQITELVSNAVDSIKQYAGSKKVELKVELSPEIPKSLMDGDRITQVLVNLLSNAIKYADSEQPKVRVTAYQMDNFIKVNVIDNGTGIEAENRERIFDKFFQVKNQLRKKPAGSGLGLAICKNIIRHHLGNIYVREEQNGGTRFSFELPIHQSNQIFKQNYEQKLEKDFDRG